MANELVSNNIFTLSSLKGGLDDTDSLSSIANDACTVAENVEFVNSALGSRRKGCEAIELPDLSGIPQLDAAVWMYRHLPSSDETEAELWVVFQELASNIGGSFIYKRAASGWSSLALSDGATVTNGQGHRIAAQSLHGKLFLAYRSNPTGTDRLHVSANGVATRRVGLAEPAAPGAADTGAGALTTTRYYRVRYVSKTGDVVDAVSEPSDVVTFTPSGAGAAVRITKPVTIFESETHWDIEASLDNVDFYRISRQIVGTTTYDDSTPAATGYNTADNVLSATVGDHTLPGSCKFLIADEDRLLMFGSYEDPALASRVTWTPVFAASGEGNDERIELSSDPYLDLDGFEGGEITGASKAVNGYIFTFKESHIYRLVRTNSREKAYEATCITKARGALRGSLVEATDQQGRPSLYFLDRTTGPNRMSANGLQWIGRDIQTTWARVNVNAIVPCHGVYYSKNKQLHYWLAVDGADYPNFKIVLHINEMRDTEEGGRRGWVTVGKNNRIATAHCSVMFSSNVDTSDDRNSNLIPLIGKETWTVNGNPVEDFIQVCDIGGTDAHTAGDTASVYYGNVTTKPFILAGLFNQYEILSGALLANTSASPDGLLFVKIIKDFGKETKSVNAPFYAPTGETHNIVLLDDLRFAELYALQVSIGDLDTNVTPPEAWGVDMLQLKITGGNKA